MDTRPRYTIGAVSQRTGLSTHVIRAWERRYDVVEPTRTASGARLYSAADLLRLRLLRQGTESGLPIGTIAALPLTELMALAKSSGAAGESLPTDPGEGGPAPMDAAILVAVEAMDPRGMQTGLRRALAYHGAQEFVGRVAAPLLRRVGELWEDASICPAQEHLFSVELRRELQHLLDVLQPTDDSPALVATTLSGEPHELGAMMAAVVAAGEGWQATYIGPDLPPEDIATAVRIRGAAAVLISVIGPVTRRALVPHVQRLAELLPDGTAVIYGGPGAAPHANAIEEAGSTYLPDLDGLAVELRSQALSGAASAMMTTGAGS